MNRQDKAAEVESIRGLLAGAQIVVLTEYAGLDVEAMKTLRSTLREAQGGYRVMKNTLARIATAGNPDLEGLQAHFSGPIGVAYSSDDPAATAKALMDFKKTHDALQLKVAALQGGTLLDVAGIEALSKLPTRDELRGQLLSVLNAVPRKFVRLLATPSRNFVGVLAARVRELEAA